MTIVESARVATVVGPVVRVWVAQAVVQATLALEIFCDATPRQADDKKVYKNITDLLHRADNLHRSTSSTWLRFGGNERSAEASTLTRVLTLVLNRYSGMLRMHSLFEVLRIRCWRYCCLMTEILRTGEAAVYSTHVTSVEATLFHVVV